MNGDWTLEAWIKIYPAFDDERDVILYYGDPGGGYSLSVNYAAGNMLQVTTLGIADLPSDTAVVEVDAWQHVAVVHKKGESITYFVNGVAAGTRAETRGNNFATTNMVLYIGAESDGGLPFSGLIDRVRISNTALTAAELDSDPLNPAASPLRLAIVLSPSNIILSWPEAGSAGAVLEFSDVLPSANWTVEPTAPVVSAGQKTVAVPITGSARFYRLKRP